VLQAPWMPPRTLSATGPRRARFVEAQADRQVFKRLYDAIARRPDVPRDLIDELKAELDRMPDPTLSLIATEAACPTRRPHYSEVRGWTGRLAEFRTLGPYTAWFAAAWIVPSRSSTTA